MAAIVPGYISDIPPFKGVLSDDEITAVIAFIKNSWPPQESTYQEARNCDRE